MEFMFTLSKWLFIFLIFWLLPIFIGIKLAKRYHISIYGELLITPILNYFELISILGKIIEQYVKEEY